MNLSGKTLGTTILALCMAVHVNALYAKTFKTEPSHYILINGINDCDSDFQDMASTYGKAYGRDVPVGAGFILSLFNEAPDRAELRLNHYLALSQKYDIPVLVQLDVESWWNNRPDLWNWWDKNKPGYNPNNRNNVEWTDWTPDSAVQIGWRDWGRQLRVLPMPNLMSPAYRSAAHTELERHIRLVVKWWKSLPDDRKYLLVGIKLGWESSIGVNNWYYPNGNALLNKASEMDPQYGLNTDKLPDRGVKTIGYAAVKTADIAHSGSMTGKMQAEIVRRHLEDLCKLAFELGMPRERLFTHCGGWAEGEDNYYAALNPYSCPGWSFYKYAANPRQDVTAMNAVKKNKAPYWAATEWLLKGQPTQKAWTSAIRKTLYDANARYMCIYNWSDVQNTPGAMEAIIEVSNTNRNGVTQYVDPFIGADGGGYAFPGVSMPSGMVKVGPDCNDLTENSGWDKRGNIVGFSHTHLCGSGGGCKYGNILIMPTTGDINPLDYSSPHQNDRSEIGLYTTELNRYQTSVRISATNHAAIHEYTFRDSEKSNVLIDLGSFLASIERQEFVGSEVTILSDTEVEGFSRIRGGWNFGRAYTVYFYAKFDHPCIASGTWKSGKVFPGVVSQFDSNEKTGAYLTFNTKDHKQVKVKVGISYMGTNKARQNASEIRDWNLDEVKVKAVNAWEDILGKVKVEGGTEDIKKIFYSSMNYKYTDALLVYGD